MLQIATLNRQNFNISGQEIYQIVRKMVQTKKIIKDAFWELLEEKPYNKITVRDIVNRCCVNRNTFYYYFQDIPTLMVDSIEECMKRKKAFLNLFHSAQKDAFLYDLNRMGYDIINAYVDKIGENREILKEEKESFIRCYKCVFVGSILGWLEEDASYDLSTFYEELCKIFSGSGLDKISEKQD